MTSEEIARLKVLASSVNPADAWLADDDRSYDVADVLRTFAPVLGELERVTEENEALRAEVERLRAENTRLAPRLRAGQRIVAAVDKIDPDFAREANGTAVDPFQHDDRCEAFLLAWSAHLRGKTDAAPRMWGPTPSVTEAAAHQARLGGASTGAPWLVREVDEAPFPSSVIGVVRVQAINIGRPDARPSWFPTLAELNCGAELDPAAYEWCALSWDGAAMPRIAEPAAAVEQATNDDVGTRG